MGSWMMTAWIRRLDLTEWGRGTGRAREAGESKRGPGRAREGFVFTATRASAARSENINMSSLTATFTINDHTTRSRGGFSTEIQPIQIYMAENTTGAAYGGHDNDFIDKIPRRFICQICTKVLCEPHLAVCCGQHFCESCLNKWFARQRGKQSCPHCCRAEGEAFHHVINKGLRSEVNQLKLRCCHHGKGCQWTGELGALKAHLESESGCGFVMVECPNALFLIAHALCYV